MPNTTSNTPRIGKFSQDPFYWSDGTPFNGFLLVSLVPPLTYSDGNLGLCDPAETLPDFSPIPIVNGIINGALGLYYNGEISPPSTTYLARWYDTTKTLISGPSIAFSVSTETITTLPTPTLTAPSSGGTPPTPN